MDRVQVRGPHVIKKTKGGSCLQTGLRDSHLTIVVLTIATEVWICNLKGMGFVMELGAMKLD